MFPDVLLLPVEFILCFVYIVIFFCLLFDFYFIKNLILWKLYNLFIDCLIYLDLLIDLHNLFKNFINKLVNSLL